MNQHTCSGRGDTVGLAPFRLHNSLLFDKLMLSLSPYIWIYREHQLAGQKLLRYQKPHV